MIKARKLLSLILTICIITSLIPGLFSTVFAAAEPITIIVDSYSSGTLNISWSGAVPGVDTVNLVYHTPSNTDNTTATAYTVPISLGTSKAQITGLRNDFIYDIRIQMLSGGVVVGEGLLYFLPAITFTSTVVKETVVDTNPPGFQPAYDPKGGREIGTKPRLNLKWNMPKVFNGASFDYAQNSLGYMQGQINGVYNEGRILSSLNYRINISPNATDMSMTDAVIIDGVNNTAYVSGADADKASVSTSGNTMSVDILGRASSTSAAPTTSGGILGHKGIYPGSVYYMSIQTIFNNYTDAVYLNQGASSLSGKPYAYTPIRFQLSKDDAENVYAKVYTVNQGSLQLPDLYYEVQTNTTDSENGWVTKARIDPDYFKDSNGKYLEFGIIPIIGVSPNNNIYYRIVATSASTDSIKSQNLPYKMAQDLSRPPIPKGISIINKVLSTNGNKKSTDITISWDKPSNWEEIKSNTDPSLDTYFCIMLNVSPNEITTTPYPVLKDEDGTTYNQFPAKYRLVRYINARSVSGTGTDKIIENGNKLEYTIKGFDLFKWANQYGELENFPVSLPDGLKPEADYPTYLLSNTVYYMQMYTTKGVPGGDENSSERSVTTSFTTLSKLEKDVPLPTNFMLSANGNIVDVNSTTHKVTNTIKLQFDMISSINWNDYDSTSSTTDNNKIYYDLWMSTSTDHAFTRIGSTDPAYSGENNVKFDFIIDAQNKYVTATICNFDKASATASFGYALTPNTTYYFKVSTRLVMPDSTPNYKDSAEATPPLYTGILPVTTLKGEIKPPDDNQRLPVSPLDFAIAKDSNGNLMVSGSSVTFTWEWKESDVKYTLLCTSNKLAMNASSSMYQNDLLYQGFRSAFNLQGNEIGITLDPNPSTGLLAENFSIVSEKDSSGKIKKICKYTINKWLFPNNLYYFAIQAERKLSTGVPQRNSVWVSIPVTTKLIEAPVNLLPVNDAEIGFFWTDSDTAIQPDDYSIYIQGASDTDLKQVPKSQCQVIRDSKVIEKDGEHCYVYYCRIYNLKNNTSYKIAVYKGTGNSTLVYHNDGISTKDGFHQIQVKWKGAIGYNYEVAVRAAGQDTYTTLTDSNFVMYTDISGESNPYYYEEDNQTNTNENGIFYAVVQSIPVKQSDGRIVHESLKSNVKYQVKVRAVKTDTLNPLKTAWSKYIGPVETRTEFNQDDYDDNEDQKDKEIKFLDGIKELEENIFWRSAMNSSDSNNILLKGDRVINVLQNSGSSPVIVDMTELAASISTDVVYIPSGIVRALKTTNKNLTIRTSGAEYILKSRTLDLDELSEATAIQSSTGVNDLFFKLITYEKDTPNTGYPNGYIKNSKVYDLKLQLIGSSKTDTQVEDLIHDKLYNADTGLVKKKSSSLSNLYSVDITKNKEKLNAYIKQAVKDVEVDVSTYINGLLEGGNGSQSITVASTNIKTFIDTMIVKAPYIKAQGLKYPYAFYDNAAAWNRISANVIDTNNSLSFNVSAPGKYVILTAPLNTSDVPDNYWAKDCIERFTSKFDLSDVFSGINKSFSPDSAVSIKEAILLYEKILGKTSENVGMDIRQKAQKLSLNDVFNMNGLMKGISRQQAAVLLMRVYAQKTGVDESKLKLEKGININDDAKIDNNCFSSVEMTVDLGITTLDSNGNFNPTGSVSRAAIITMFTRLMELTGDM